MVKLDAERSELAISSAYWDTVTKVGEVYLYVRISCIRNAEQFFSQIVTYPTGEDMGAAKLKTMVGNYICDGETLEDIRIAYETWFLPEMNADTNVNDPDTFPKKSSRSALDVLLKMHFAWHTVGSHTTWLRWGSS